MEQGATPAQQATIASSGAVMALSTGDGGVVIKNQNGVFLIDRVGNLYDLELIDSAKLMMDRALEFEIASTGGIH